MYVEEKDRPWTSSNWQNDDKAITIEVSNSARGGDWPVGEKAMESLINLLVDICKRNPGIGKLKYTGDETGNMTLHKWFIGTTCPGPYLERMHPYIAQEVNRRLGFTEVEPNPEPDEGPNPKPDEGEEIKKLKVGDKVKLTKNATYSNGKSIASFVFNKILYVRNISGENITISIYKTGAITGTVNIKYLERVQE